MSVTDGMGSALIGALASDFETRQIPLGEDATIRRRGLAINVSAFEVAGLCHVGILKISAPLGIAGVEAIMVAPVGVTAPIMNLDLMDVGPRRLVLAEFYDMGAESLAPEATRLLEELKTKTADLAVADGDDEARWYDAHRLDVSVRLSGGVRSERVAEASCAYAAAMAALIEEAPAAAVATMQEATASFATRLFTEGGPAVELLTTLAGPERARRIIVGHLYGVYDEDARVGAAKA